MRCEISGFYFITDSGYTKQGAVKDAADAIRGGANIIQYREKAKPFSERAVEASGLAALCEASNVIFIVNDDIELAMTVKADGLHLGPHDMSPAEARKAFSGILGVSCGSVREVIAAKKAGADYIAASPVFFTPTKSFDDYDLEKSLGLEGVRELREATTLPIIAIGGVKLGNVAEIIAAGADAVCAISATVGADNVEASVRKFVEAIAHAR